MAEPKDHIENIFNTDKVLSQETMQKYLDGDLTPQEMHEVERIMVENDIYDDALEGMELMKENPTLSETHLSDIKASIPSIVGIENTSKRRFLYPMIGGIAASVALIIGFIYLSGSEKINQESPTQTAYKKEASEQKLYTEDAKELEATVEEATNEKVSIPEENTAFLNKPIVATQDDSEDLTPETAFKLEADKELVKDKRDERLVAATEKTGSSGVETRNFSNEFYADPPQVDEMEEVMMDDIMADSVGFPNQVIISMNDSKNTADYAALSQDMLAMADPAMIHSRSLNGVTAIESDEDLSSDAGKIRKEKVATPRYRDDSFQAKSHNKKEHKGKQKADDVTPTRAAVDLGADAEMKFANQEYEKAASLYELTLQQHPSDAQSLYKSGVSYIKTGEAEKAIKNLRLVTGDKTVGDDAQWYLAVAYIQNGDPENAKSVLQQLADSSKSAHAQNAQTMLTKLK